MAWTATTEVMVDDRVLSDLCAHARRAAPREACGLLGGPDGQGAASLVLDRYLPLRNLEVRTARFVMDPVGIARAERALAAEGRHLAAAFHTHPGGAPTPSEADRTAAWPQLLQLILGGTMAREDLRAFRIDAETGVWRACPIPVAAPGAGGSAAS